MTQIDIDPTTLRRTDQAIESNNTKALTQALKQEETQMPVNRESKAADQTKLQVLANQQLLKLRQTPVQS